LDVFPRIAGFSTISGPNLRPVVCGRVVGVAADAHRYWWAKISAIGPGELALVRDDDVRPPGCRAETPRNA